MAEIVRTEGADYTLLKVESSRLDALIAPRLKSQFVIEGATQVCRVVLDLSACTFCDSSGLSAILAGHRICRNSGGVLVLRGIAPSVERLIKISQLDGVLHIAYTPAQEEEFLAGIRPPHPERATWARREPSKHDTR